MSTQSNGTAIITGAAKRIGKEIALSLAENGYDIALHYNHSKKEATNVKRQIEKLDKRCELFKADFLNDDETFKLIKRVMTVMSGCDLLVNNASVYNAGLFIESDMDLLRKEFRINFEVPYQLSRSFAKNIDKGQIINIIDTKINQLTTEYFCYSLSKKTLYEFTKMAAKELGPSIRVNGICPGPILPPPNENDDYLVKKSKMLPLEKVGKPEWISETVLFLIKNSYITGECIHVDGGEHLIS